MTKLQYLGLAGQKCTNEFKGETIVTKYDAGGIAFVENDAFADLLVSACGHVILERDAEAPDLGNIIEGAELIAITLSSVRRVLDAPHGDLDSELLAEIRADLPGAAETILGLGLDVRRAVSTAGAEVTRLEAKLEKIIDANKLLTAKVAELEAAPAQAAAPAAVTAPAASDGDEGAADGTAPSSGDGKPKNRRK